MSDNDSNFGTIDWVDLTVDKAERIRDFYTSVVGWRSEPVDMKGYDDFCMIPSAGKGPVAGICHARGENADLPAQWLIYATVANLENSIRQCEELGGKVLSAPRMAGNGQICVIQDPAGAVMGLYEGLA